MNSDKALKPDVSYESEHSTAPPWDERMTIIMTIAFSSLLLVLGVVFWSVIPFTLATTVIAYLLNPLTEFLQKRVTFGRRGWAVLLTFLIILVIIMLVFIVLLPPLIEQSINGITSLWTFLVNLFTQPIFINPETPLIRDPATTEAIAISDYINVLLAQQGFSTVSEWLISTGQNLTLDRETIQQFFSIGGGLTTGVLGSVFIIAGSTLSLVINTVFFLTILATLLGGGRKLSEAVLDAVPDGYESDAQRLVGDLGGVWDSYVRGNFTLGLIMGFAMWTMAIILGLPNPLFLAFVAFAMEFVPNVGPTIAIGIAAAMAIGGGSSTFPGLSHFAVGGMVVLIWFVMQQLEATVLVPRIVGESLKLHPAIVILSVIWGGSFAGIIGVIIAPPLVASIRILLHYIYGRLTGRTAFTKREPESESTVSRIKRLADWVEKMAARIQQNRKKK
jgi:predicted PurR-regulated permease PerM